MTRKKKPGRKIVPGECFAYRNPLEDPPWTLLGTRRGTRDSLGNRKRIDMGDVLDFGIKEELLLEAEARGMEPEVLDFVPDFYQFFWKGRLEPFKEKEGRR